MNIQFHIKNLLYRHDCVIVGGLGGFVTQKQTAKIEDGYFLPPRKRLTFNQNLKESSDALLANQIAKEEKVSFQIAQQKIKVFSQKILETLEDEADIYLKDLGHFKLNADRKLVFEPDTKLDWLIEAYGLPKFKVDEITIAQNKVAKTKPVEPISSPDVKTLNEVQSRRSNYWKYAAIGIVAIGISGLVGSQIYQKEIKAYNLVQQEKAKHLIDQKIQESSFLVSKPLKALSVEVESKKTGKYHIVGGAFRIRANANKKIKQLKKQGFDAKYIGANKYGLHQVVYASFDDKLKALKKLRQIKSQNNPYAWLYVKEL
ncbi:HU domain-containing protein [Psychroflexus sp. MBR-150]|jgi:nucleoid DNA-binding protein